MPEAGLEAILKQSRERVDRYLDQRLPAEADPRDRRGAIVLTAELVRGSVREPRRRRPAGDRHAVERPGETAQQAVGADVERVRPDQHEVVGSPRPEQPFSESHPRGVAEVFGLEQERRRPQDVGGDQQHNDRGTGLDLDPAADDAGSGRPGDVRRARRRRDPREHEP